MSMIMELRCDDCGDTFRISGFTDNLRKFAARVGWTNQNYYCGLHDLCPKCSESHEEERRNRIARLKEIERCT